MKKFFLFISFYVFSQENQSVFGIDFNFGKTMPANEYFHELKPFKGFSISYGIKHNDTLKNWSNFLKNPTTGILLQYNDFGNIDNVGVSYALLPFIEFPLNPKRNLNMQLALGISYFTVLHDTETNWYNRAISTRYNWAFRKFIYYNLYHSNSFSHQLGLGFIHHSNGHVNWPNQGLNTFVFAYNVQFQKQSKFIDTPKKLDQSNKNLFYSIRSGLGFRALSRFENKQEKVYTTAFSIGNIYDNTYKLSIGFNYKFYENYYSYIKDNKDVVANIYPELKNNIVYNSSTYGFFLNGEMMLGYISGEFELGFNIDKPFYKVDFRINESRYKDGDFVLGDLNTTYQIKRFVYTRMGLKAYLINNNSNPKTNIFVGGFINSNLTQADFSEISIGIVRKLN
ncbi:MAG: acyloxyacyl hydrolase [Flavobacterium sp.]